jgi:MraZ protein
VLIGQYPGILGFKRRIAIPKKFRQILGEKFIIARWYENCLVIVSLTSWQELLKKITGKSRVITAPIRNTDRFILGSAFEVVADDQGRIIIPENLAKYAALKNKIIFVGLKDRVEVWNQEAWEKQEKHIAQHAAQMIEEIAKEDRG